MVTLPQCRFRKPREDARFNCDSPVIKAPNGVTAEYCSTCKHADKDYGTLSLPVVSSPCSHEGPILEWCHKSGESNHVRECDLHERCTRNGGTVYRRCSQCNDYTTEETHISGNSINKIFLECGTDKTKHKYAHMYGELFRRCKNIRNMLEIGVLAGNSIRAWQRIFPQAKVIGADVVGGDILLDVTNAETFAQLADNSFDLIIDDSTHDAADQLRIRTELWRCLRPQGIMVIEDVYSQSAADELQNRGGRVWDYRAQTSDPYSRAFSFEKSELMPRIVRPPRVLFALHELSLTGAPIIIANLIPSLRGIDPIVFSPTDGPLRARFAERGISVTTRFDLTGVDYVVANSLPSATVVQAAHAAKIPCTWLIHEADPSMCHNIDLVRDVIRYPEYVVFPSASVAAEYAQFGIDLLVIPSTIPPVPIRFRDAARAALGIDPAAFVILSFGADEPRKGQEDIRLAAPSDATVLLISGTPDPWTYYAAADVYICSSRLEAYPLALQEAKAYRLPVITTPVFGCAEIIQDGVNGLHYPPGDVPALRACIDRIRGGERFAETQLPRWDETVRRYEALILGASPQDLQVVYHVAGLGDRWKSIVDSQLEALATVGLNQVLATHVGVEPNWLIDRAAKYGIRLTLCEHQRDVKNWEVPAMRLIERIARCDDRPILYLHSKGVSQSNRVFHDWRRLMMLELVEPWKKHLPYLQNFDIIGVNWWKSYPHFSGNFWIARADWIRKLPRFDSIFTDRYSCERWIGGAPNPRVKSLVCKDVKFWDSGREILYKALERHGENSDSGR